MRVARRIGLVKIAKAVDPIRHTIRKRRVILERPALITKPRNGDGNADRAGELFQRAVDLGAMRPWAGVSDIKVIAAGFGFEAGRAVGGDAFEERTRDALKVTGLSGLGVRVLVAVQFAVDQHPHQATSPRATTAA